MSRNVVITGANRGIGKAMVEAFARNGDNIWACMRKPYIEFDEFSEELALKNKVRIQNVYMDLSEPSDIKEGLKQIQNEKQAVDIVINCAGIGHMGLFQMASDELIRTIYEVNVFSLMEICRWAVRIMSRQKQGKIINISSTAAAETYVGNSIYGASKASVVAFTKSLAAEVAPLGIQVNTIAPGLTDTDMSSIFEGNDADLPLQRSALGRKLLPSEIAQIAVELTKDTMSIINGQMLCVNGGAK